MITDSMIYHGVNALNSFGIVYSSYFVLHAIFYFFEQILIVN